MKIEHSDRSICTKYAIFFKSNFNILMCLLELLHLFLALCLVLSTSQHVADWRKRWKRSEAEKRCTILLAGKWNLLKFNFLTFFGDCIQRFCFQRFFFNGLWILFQRLCYFPKTSLPFGKKISVVLIYRNNFCHHTQLFAGIELSKRGILFLFEW